MTIPGAQPPEEPTPADQSLPHTTVAGLTAVWQSLKFMARESGFRQGLSTWMKVNQKDGFDCQSCAWPSPDDDRHTFEFCENGAKALASEATRKLITPEFFANHSIADLSTRSDHWMEKQGRLAHPMVRHPDATHYEPISWDDAFALLAAELRALPTPDAAAFYTSGRASNEAAFLYQLFVRMFGTNNLPDCSNMCHESSGVALVETIGVGKGCVTLEDFEKADCIFIIGQNPGTNHPRMLTSLQHAKERGATIVSLNPMPEPGLMRVVNPNPEEYPNILKFPGTMLLNRATSLTDLWLPVRINGDLAALRGIIKEMVAAEDAGTPVFDREFIAAHTDGFDAFMTTVRAADWDELTETSGLTRDQIAEAAAIAIRSKRIICCWAMGLTQHKNAVATIQEVVNFLLLGGHIGRPGAGPCPVRGHSNVQGDRTMGIWERMAERFMDDLVREFRFTPPAAHGVDTVEAIQQMHDGTIRVFFALGGNFLSATPARCTATYFPEANVLIPLCSTADRSNTPTSKSVIVRIDPSPAAAAAAAKFHSFS
jgi:molybdopterin-dependent oxidoreductase alpha subunit